MSTANPPESRNGARILGIDPGSRFTGVGIIDVDARGKLTHVFHAAIAVGGEASFPLRLKRIYDEVCAIIGTHQPNECGIERVFMARNADSALKLGQARGAAICAVVSRGVQVHEYAATEVKQSVVGGGRADKTQVQHMVAILLGLKAPMQADAADALAIAVTHAHMRAGLERTGLTRAAWRRRR
ncbi:MAG TPA: crossover junction endodeoxyribonuclease RuvC [Oleiagrimonas sp.]|nr:crossover junction endodeoxyribonuclease RuvC [Oleiagrimonas sp.]